MCFGSAGTHRPYPKGCYHWLTWPEPCAVWPTSIQCESAIFWNCFLVQPRKVRAASAERRQRLRFTGSLEPNAGHKISSPVFSEMRTPLKRVYTVRPPLSGERCDFLREDTVRNIPAPIPRNFNLRKMWGPVYPGATVGWTHRGLSAVWQSKRKAASTDAAPTASRAWCFSSPMWVASLPWPVPNGFRNSAK